MKREFIKGLLPDIADEVLQQIMDAHSKDIGQHTAKISSLETERDGLKTQLDEANRSIQSYKDMDIDGIKKSAADWKTKYDTDTKALQDKLTAQAYDFAVEGIVPAAERFSSTSARKAFMSELKAKGLKLEDGKLLGYDEFLKAYKESDPDAFAPDDTDGTPPPTVVSRTHGGSGGGMDALRAAFGLPNTKKE